MTEPARGLRLGTRASALAVRQAEWVSAELSTRVPDLRPEIICIKTSGDRIQARSLAELGGKGQLRCSDGSSAMFHFQRLSIWNGHGAGTFSRGAMSFSYGLTAGEAAAYVKLPKGKKLAHDGKEMALVDLPD